MKKTITLFLCILLTLFIGGLGGIATASGVNDWYLEIQKPSFNPPNYLFGPVWTALYLLMGVSLYMILQGPKSQIKTKAIWIFAIQLSLNFAWSFLFFKFHLLGLAFIEIILIWLSILTMIIVFSKINKTAAYLQIPYLLWVSFASVLNGTIWFLNS
jgi:benzodiazapine receptor